MMKFDQGWSICIQIRQLKPQSPAFYEVNEGVILKEARHNSTWKRESIWKPFSGRPKQQNIIKTNCNCSWLAYIYLLIQLKLRFSFKYSDLREFLKMINNWSITLFFMGKHFSEEGSTDVSKCDWRLDWDRFAWVSTKFTGGPGEIKVWLNESL